MAFFDDDACPFDWAEYNLPAELLSQAGAMLAAFGTPAAVTKVESAMPPRGRDEPPPAEAQHVQH